MKKIKNGFFDIILFLLSGVVSLARSFTSLFSKKSIIKRSSFFDSIDYIFRIWPSYFWKKPSLFKIGFFLGAFIKYIFYKKK